MAYGTDEMPEPIKSSAVLMILQIIQQMIVNLKQLIIRARHPFNNYLLLTNS